MPMGYNHRSSSTLCCQILATVTLIVVVRPTESGILDPNDHHHSTVVHDQGVTTTAATSGKWENLLEDIWNNQEEGGALRVDQKKFFAFPPVLVQKWKPFAEQERQTTSTSTSNILDSQTHTTTVVNCKVLPRQQQQLESLALNGRQLAWMLTERMLQSQQQQQQQQQGATDFVFENEQLRRIAQSTNMDVCHQPRRHRFSWGTWMLDQIEFTTSQKQQQQQSISDLLTFPSHLVLATPMYDSDKEPNFVWIILNKNRNIVESLKLLDSIHSKENISQWHIVSYYLTTKQRVQDEPSVPFCKGMPMVAFMDGFQRSLQQPPRMCLNYFFPSWKLLDAGQFKGAMVYSFLLAFLTEGLFAIRAVVLQHVVIGKGRKTLLIMLYVLQQAMGYIIMLVAMMYSVELFCSVVFGLAAGHLLFVRGEDNHHLNHHQQQLQQQPRHSNPQQQASLSSAAVSSLRVVVEEEELAEITNELQLQSHDVLSIHHHHHQATPALKLD